MKFREVEVDPRDAAGWEPGVEAAVQTLETGGLLVHPTSTVYGIGGAVGGRRDAEINRLKTRPAELPLILLAGSAETLRRELPGATWDGRAERLAAAFWPGPLTIVLDDRSPDGVAVRVDGHPLLLVVLGRWRSLMTSSSLNVGGGAPAATPAEARRVLGDMAETGFDVTLLAAGSLPASRSSTIVSLRETPARILREGPLDGRRIASCMREEPA